MLADPVKVFLFKSCLRRREVQEVFHLIMKNIIEVGGVGLYFAASYVDAAGSATQSQMRQMTTAVQQ